MQMEHECDLKATHVANDELVGRRIHVIAMQKREREPDGTLKVQRVADGRNRRHGQQRQEHGIRSLVLERLVGRAGQELTQQRRRDEARPSRQHGHNLVDELRVLHMNHGEMQSTHVHLFDVALARFEVKESQH